MKKLDKDIKVLLIIIFVLLLGIFAISGYQIYTILHGYKVAADTYETMSSTYVTTAAPAPTAQPGNTAAEPVPTRDPREYTPVTVDFDALIAECPDVVGWLYSPNTVINYPVAQGKDNDYYLYRLIDGSDNANGTLFVDYNCNREFYGQNTIIYGHHMNDGSMLASLCKYSDQAYYDEHPYMFLNTPSGNYRLDLFSGFTTPDNSAAYKMFFSGDTEFDRYITAMKGYSDFASSVEVTTDDRLIMFSTCTYDYENARYVLFGKLVPLTDEAGADTVQR